MKRAAWFIMRRQERGQWTPRFMACWAFDYLMKTGTPANVSSITLTAPQTWTTSSAANFTVTSTTWPLSPPDNPYR